MASHDPSADDVVRLESVIRAARVYVHPTDDLRPRTLEAARERVTLLRGRRRVFAVAAAVVVTASLSLPGKLVPQHAGWSRSEFPPAAGEAELPGVRRSMGGQFDSIWAVYEAFRELRARQAAPFASREVPANR